MELGSKFLSVDNKRILWDLLLKNNIFSNIPTTKENLVKETFEKNIIITAELCNKNLNESKTLIDYNKSFISSIVPILNKMKMRRSVTFQDETSRDYTEHSSVPRTLRDDNVITAEKQKQIRQDAFSSNLESKQREFTDMMDANIPSKIDFSDSVEEQHITDMDKRLETIMNSRDSDIKILFKDNPPPTSNNVVSKTNKGISVKNRSGNKRLVIEGDTIVNDIILLTDVERSSIHNKSVSRVLEEILSNQKIILERLATIKII